MKIRTHLESLPPYTPIEPFEILSARIGREPSQIVKLDANENPYGILPTVRKALAEMDFPHMEHPAGDWVSSTTPPCFF